MKIDQMISSTIAQTSRTLNQVSALLLTFSLCLGCSEHYCPTYASHSYNQTFTYAATKSLNYRPVKVLEFKSSKADKSEKKKKKTKSTF